MIYGQWIDSLRPKAYKELLKGKTGRKNVLEEKQHVISSLMGGTGKELVEEG